MKNKTCTAVMKIVYIIFATAPMVMHFLCLIHVHLYLDMKMTIVWSLKCVQTKAIRSIGTVVISEFNYKTAIWDNSKTISSAPAIVIPVFILKP